MFVKGIFIFSVILYSLLFGKVKMLQFLVMFCLTVNLITANASPNASESKPESVDELNKPNVVKSKSSFTFKETIISFLNNKDIAFIIFDLTVNRQPAESALANEDDIPLIIDTLISDLFPSVNLFINTPDEVIQSSLEQRISRVLMAKFKWITGVKMSRLRIQSTNQ
jgi:hypothetical protein